MAWAPDYLLASELKSYLRIDDDDDDARVALAITAASRAVDRSCNRQFGLVAAPEARTYTARWDEDRCRWVVEIDDLMTQVGLTVATEAGSITEYSLQPGNASDKGRPWTRLLVKSTSAIMPTKDEDGVTITARWGWTSVPVAVQQATALQATRIFKRQDAPFGVAGSPEFGSELRLLAKVDPDVAVVLGPYTRWWGAV